MIALSHRHGYAHALGWGSVVNRWTTTWNVVRAVADLETRGDSPRPSFAVTSVLAILALVGDWTLEVLSATPACDSRGPQLYYSTDLYTRMKQGRVVSDYR